MIPFFSKDEAKYINFRDLTCVKATTPPEVIKSLEEINKAHDEMVGGEIITFI